MGELFRREVRMPGWSGYSSQRLVQIARIDATRVDVYFTWSSVRTPPQIYLRRTPFEDEKIKKTARRPLRALHGRHRVFDR